MEKEPFHDFIKDASTLAFNIIYQAISDAFDMSNISSWGGGRGKMNKNHPFVVARRKDCKMDAVRFIESEEMVDMCKLSSLYYYTPSPATIRKKYRDYMDGKVDINLKDLIRVANEKKKPAEEVDYDDVEVKLNFLKRTEDRKMF